MIGKMNLKEETAAWHLDFLIYARNKSARPCFILASLGSSVPLWQIPLKTVYRVTTPTPVGPTDGSAAPHRPPPPPAARRRA